MGVIRENLSMLSSLLLVILHHLIKPVFLSADKILLFLSHIYKVLHVLRSLVASVLLILFHSLETFYYHGEQQLADSSNSNSSSSSNCAAGRGGDTAIGRAICQLLTLVNSIPASSRKYQLVRSLVEELIDVNNLEERSEVLRQINCVVLSEAFGKTLLQLEAALLDQENKLGVGLGLGLGPGGFGLRRVVKSAAKGWYWGKEVDGPATEKMAAELLWLAQKMEESGGGEVVVEKWGWARNLGCLALAAEPMVQASLVRLTAFLIKHAEDWGKEQRTKGSETEQQKQKMVKMLMTWLPLLCRASNATDTPIFNTSEQKEIERALEGMIDMIEETENQEKVLSLWVHHFAKCSSSDWPNLYGSYVRWCKSSRKLLLTAG